MRRVQSSHRLLLAASLAGVTACVGDIEDAEVFDEADAGVLDGAESALEDKRRGYSRPSHGRGKKLSEGGVINPVSPIGEELSVPNRLQDGDEFDISLGHLLHYGEQLFAANWTTDEGGGRPLTTGTGADLVDPTKPLLFPRNFNRISAPDANSCAGCHNKPLIGGGGDIVANVFVTGQRFDFLTFESGTPGGTLENGDEATLQNVANSRNTLGMFGSGYIEMLARQMTEELQAQRDDLGYGQAVRLVAKGVSFGMLYRKDDGSWDTSKVEGLTPMSLESEAPDDPPSLILRPFHQASAVVSLREFTNNAFNHHHGMQSTERFGALTDPDGDGITAELNRADITATSVWQATLGVPGRVIPRSKKHERAIARGEDAFMDVGCGNCHLPSLTLEDRGWIYSEPNPFNPTGNLQEGDAPTLSINLNDRRLPGPRLRKYRGKVEVPAYTDMKLHDITCGPMDPNREPVNMHFTPADDEFFEGNGRFLTRKLWGVANEPPYFHHGQYTTLRQAVEAHCGEADAERAAFQALSPNEQADVIEFLKSLQVLPPGTKHRVVDERGRKRRWRGLP